MSALLGYLASIVAVNVAFTVAPHPLYAAVIVGATFVLRDRAHLAAGGKAVFKATVVGACITAAFNLNLALVSGGVFLISEVLDQIVFGEVMDRVRSYRWAVFASHLVGVTVDSVLFLLGVGAFSWPTLAMMLASKSVALVVLLKR